MNLELLRTIGSTIIHVDDEEDFEVFDDEEE